MPIDHLCKMQLGSITNRPEAMLAKKMRSIDPLMAMIDFVNRSYLALPLVSLAACPILPAAGTFLRAVRPRPNATPPTPRTERRSAARKSFPKNRGRT